jgi:hypothetical protein
VGRFARRGPLARWHVTVVHKARIAPEPLSCTRRSFPAVRAFLRRLKEGVLSVAMECESGTVRRPARRLSRARYTHHDGGTGGPDGIGAAAVLECPEEATPSVRRAISQVLLHMDG